MAERPGCGCPACGSTRVSHTTEQRHQQAPLGPPVEYNADNYECQECGTDGDFTGGNDARIERAYQESVERSMPIILEALSTAGITQAYFERALGLPARTLAQWQIDDKHSMAVVALLRIIKTFPGLLAVADEGFE
jgi:DNA-binding transcriptional regulator YiaG